MLAMSSDALQSGDNVISMYAVDLTVDQDAFEKLRICDGLLALLVRRQPMNSLRCQRKVKMGLVCYFCGAEEDIQLRLIGKSGAAGEGQPTITAEKGLSGRETSAPLAERLLADLDGLGNILLGHVHERRPGRS
jgi:hypothetical protein